jgi:hypothetical protein
MGGARSGLGGPMCLRVLRVSGMPCNVEIWIDDGVDCFTIYIDKELITEQGADALQRILRTTVAGWQRVDNDAVLRTLRAVTG